MACIELKVTLKRSHHSRSYNLAALREKLVISTKLSFHRQHESKTQGSVAGKSTSSNFPATTFTTEKLAGISKDVQDDTRALVQKAGVLI